MQKKSSAHPAVNQMEYQAEVPRQAPGCTSILIIAYLKAAPGAHTKKGDLVTQVPDWFLQDYFDVAGAVTGDAGTLVPDGFALFLPSQAKALPHINTPDTIRIATKACFISNLLFHHWNTIRQFLAVHLKSAGISCAKLAVSVKKEHLLPCIMGTQRQSKFLYWLP